MSTLLANKDSDGNRHPIIFGGVDGGTVNNGWTFRLTFAGITNDPNCTKGYCLAGLFYSKITAGSANGSFDVVEDPSVACGFAVAVTPGPVSSQSYTDAACSISAGGSPGTPAITAELVLGGRNVDGLLASQGYVILTTGLGGRGSRANVYFEQAFDICDFYDGMVLNNNLTTNGCKTFLEGGTGEGKGTGGTCTITRVACS
jgi:hypothetical protein